MEHLEYDVDNYCRKYYRGGEDISEEACYSDNGVLTQKLGLQSDDAVHQSRYLTYCNLKKAMGEKFQLLINGRKFICDVKADLTKANMEQQVVTSADGKTEGTLATLLNLEPGALLASITKGYNQLHYQAKKQQKEANAASRSTVQHSSGAASSSSSGSGSGFTTPQKRQAASSAQQQPEKRRSTVEAQQTTPGDGQAAAQASQSAADTRSATKQTPDKRASTSAAGDTCNNESDDELEEPVVQHVSKAGTARRAEAADEPGLSSNTACIARNTRSHHRQLQAARKLDDALACAQGKQPQVAEEESSAYLDTPTAVPISTASCSMPAILPPPSSAGPATPLTILARTAQPPAATEHAAGAPATMANTQPAPSHVGQAADVLAPQLAASHVPASPAAADTPLPATRQGTTAPVMEAVTPVMLASAQQAGDAPATTPGTQSPTPPVEQSADVVIATPTTIQLPAVFAEPLSAALGAAPRTHQLPAPAVMGDATAEDVAVESEASEQLPPASQTDKASASAQDEDVVIGMLSPSTAAQTQLLLSMLTELDPAIAPAFQPPCPPVQQQAGDAHVPAAATSQPPAAGQEVATHATATATAAQAGMQPASSATATAMHTAQQPSNHATEGLVPAAEPCSPQLTASPAAEDAPPQEHGQDEEGSSRAELIVNSFMQDIACTKGSLKQLVARFLDAAIDEYTAQPTGFDAALDKMIDAVDDEANGVSHIAFYNLPASDAWQKKGMAQWRFLEEHRYVWKITQLEAQVQRLKAQPAETNRTAPA